MTIDLSGIGTWIWVLALLVILYIILRYFFHVVVHIVQLVFKFFWRGCATLLILILIYYILRALRVF